MEAASSSRDLSCKGRKECPTCGKTFQRLGQHKCKGPGTQAASDAHVECAGSSQVGAKYPKCPTNADGKNSSTNKSHTSTDTAKEMCPSCGKGFLQLQRHKCKAHSTSSLGSVVGSDPGSFCQEQSPVESRPAESGLECELTQKQLSQPKVCKGSHLPSVKAEGKGSYSEISCDEGSSVKQVCPACKKSFKSLSRHKCKAATPPTDKISEVLLCPSGPVCSSYIKSEKCSPRASEHVPKQLSDRERNGGLKCAPAPAARIRNGSKRNDSKQDSGKLTNENTLELLNEHKYKTSCPDGAAPNDGYTETEIPVVGSAPFVSHTVVQDAQSALRPAQNARGYIPIINTKSLEEVAQAVMDTLGISVSAKPNFEASCFFDEEIKIEKHEKNTVAGAFNNFRSRILSCLKEATKWTWDYISSGSSYDGTKVARADEIDCMFQPTNLSSGLKVMCADAPPGFCFVKMIKSKLSSDDKELLALCNEEGFVSSQKFRQRTFQIFQSATDAERRAKVDPEYKPGSPSFAVLLDSIPRETGMTCVSIDLVPSLHLNGLPPGSEGSHMFLMPAEDSAEILKGGFEVIPKEYQKDDDYAQFRDFLWRLSFSRAEKKMTKFTDIRTPLETTNDTQANKIKSPVTCKKQVLRTLKRLLEIIKGFENSRARNPKTLEIQKAVKYLREKGGRSEKIEKFTTFQVRTLWWTEIYVTCCGEEKWTTPYYRTRLMHILLQLKKMISGRMSVPHFFVKDLDIMGEVPIHEREFLYIMFTIIEKLF